MTATERRDRGPLKSLLHKMRKANEVVSPRVGYYALPSNPLNPVDLVDLAISDGAPAGQDTDNTDVSGSRSGQRSGQRQVNGGESVDLALTGPEQANPLDGNGDTRPGQQVNGVNGIERGAASAPLADTPLDDDPIPVPKHHCDHCGSATGITYPYDWPGRPDGIRLHRRCEEGWHDLMTACADNPPSQRSPNGGAAKEKLT